MKIDYLKKNYCFVLRGLKYKNFKSFTLNVKIYLLKSKKKESNVSLYKPALEILRTKIKEATSSMTSVPKPLKFLRNQYDVLKQVFEIITDPITKVFLI
jgi:26S proteasome regulatory subunit N1